MNRNSFTIFFFISIHLLVSNIHTFKTHGNVVDVTASINRNKCTKFRPLGSGEKKITIKTHN